MTMTQGALTHSSVRSHDVCRYAPHACAKWAQKSWAQTDSQSQSSHAHFQRVFFDQITVAHTIGGQNYYLPNLYSRQIILGRSLHLFSVHDRESLGESVLTYQTKLPHLSLLRINSVMFSSLMAFFMKAFLALSMMAVVRVFSPSRMGSTQEWLHAKSYL